MIIKAGKKHIESLIASRVTIPTLIVLYFLTFIVGFSSLFITERISKQRLYNQIYHELQRMQYSINVYLEEMFSTASSLSSNEDVGSFFKYDELLPHQKEKISAIANTAVSISPAIRSIYIACNKLNDFLYVGRNLAKLQKADDFYDSSFFSDIRNGRLPEQTLYVRYIDDTESGNRLELVSVFDFSRQEDHDGPLTVVVVNMDTSFLYSIIESGLDIRDDVVIIIDKNEMILTQNEIFAQYSLLADYGINVTAQNSKQEFARYTHNNNKNYYVVSTESDMFGDRLLALVPASFISEALLPGRVIAIILFFSAIIIITLLWMFLNQLARKPITELLQRTNRLERGLIKDEKVQKMEVLRSVMTHGEIYPEQKRKEMIKSIGLPFDESDCVFLMEVLIHNYLGLISEMSNREYEALIFGAGNIIEDIMSADSQCMVVNRIANGSFYIIASPYNNAKERLSDIISNSIDSITSTLHETLGIKVVILYSTAVVQLHNLCILVEKTENTAANRPFFSPGTIIDVDRFKTEDYAELYRNVFQKINKYTLAMQAEDFDNAHKLCEEVFDVKDIAEMRFAWSVMTLTTLPMVCSSYPKTVSSDVTEMLNDVNTIGKLSSPEEMKSWILECHQRLCEKIRLYRSDSNCDLVTQANKIVENNYYNPELNVSYIAGKIGVSPNYLSSSYRKLTSVKLTEYIQDVRMAMARDKLTNTDMLVSDIARACGFRYNVGYFQQLFKRKHGLTPTHFREKIKTTNN